MGRWAGGGGYGASDNSVLFQFFLLHHTVPVSAFDKDGDITGEWEDTSMRSGNDLRNGGTSSQGFQASPRIAPSRTRPTVNTVGLDWTTY